MTKTKTKKTIRIYTETWKRLKIAVAKRDITLMDYIEELSKK
jgi:hypothetical protein